ncbi:MAG: NAD-dependent epimerase/dehydratase family protein, partial [Anaerolineales bacterium]
MTRRVTITGGAGFIGSAVARAALHSGLAVTVLDDLSTGYLENLAELQGVRFLRGDVRDREAVETALEGSDGVFHLAASVGNVRSIAEPLGDLDINARGTLVLLEAMRRKGPHRLVTSSSAAVYGETGAEPAREDAPCEPDSPYGVSKLAAEKECLCYGRLHGWQVACLRYFNVYGPRQRYDAYGNVIPIFAQRLAAGDRLVIYGDGLQTRDFVSVEDVAGANLAAFERGATGIFNVATGSSSRILDLAHLMMAVSGRQPGVRHDPP